MKHPGLIAILLAGLVAAMPGGARAQTDDPNIKICLGDPNPDNRLAACAKVLAVHPGDPKFSWAFNSRGNAYSQKSDLGNALKEYDAAIKLNPKDPQAYNNRGVLHLNQGQFAPAAQDFTAALKADPQDAAAYNNRGNANFHLGKMDSAIQDFGSAIKLDPRYPGAYQSRGLIYFGQEKIALAFADFDAAVKLAPKSAESLFLRAAAFRKKGDNPSADSDLAAAKLLDPNIVAKMAAIGLK
jgi:tetratricopeptide (TPR) repeat protein